MNQRSTQALADATRKRRETAEQAVQKAIRQARKNQQTATVAAIARAAGVSTDFIYRHPELRPQVEALRQRQQPHPGAPDAASAESTLIRRLTQQLTDERRKHREQTAELRAALETAHGELLTLRRQLST